MFATIALIPICMRMCSPAVAATQFTIYMALSNLGRPLGAWMAAATAGAGSPALMYWLMAAAWGVSLVIMLIVRFPGENRAFHDSAEALPQGEGLAPAID